MSIIRHRHSVRISALLLQSGHIKTKLSTIEFGSNFTLIGISSGASSRGLSQPGERHIKGELCDESRATPIRHQTGRIDWRDRTWPAERNELAAIHVWMAP